MLKSKKTRHNASGGARRVSFSEELATTKAIEPILGDVDHEEDWENRAETQKETADFDLTSQDILKWSSTLLVLVNRLYKRKILTPSQRSVLKERIFDLDPMLLAGLKQFIDDEDLAALVTVFFHVAGPDHDAADEAFQAEGEDTREDEKQDGKTLSNPHAGYGNYPEAHDDDNDNDDEEDDYTEVSSGSGTATSATPPPPPPPPRPEAIKSSMKGQASSEKQELLILDRENDAEVAEQQAREHGLIDNEANVDDDEKNQVADGSTGGDIEDNNNRDKPLWPKGTHCSLTLDPPTLDKMAEAVQVIGLPRLTPERVLEVFMTTGDVEDIDINRLGVIAYKLACLVHDPRDEDVDDGNNETNESPLPIREPPQEISDSIPFKVCTLLILAVLRIMHQLIDVDARGIVSAHQLIIGLSVLTGSPAEHQLSFAHSMLAIAKNADDKFDKDGRLRDDQDDESISTTTTGVTVAQAVAYTFSCASCLIALTMIPSIRSSDLFPKLLKVRTSALTEEERSHAIEAASEIARDMFGNVQSTSRTHMDALVSRADFMRWSNSPPQLVLDNLLIPALTPGSSLGVAGPHQAGASSEANDSDKQQRGRQSEDGDESDGDGDGDDGNVNRGVEREGGSKDDGIEVVHADGRVTREVGSGVVSDEYESQNHTQKGDNTGIDNDNDNDINNNNNNDSVSDDTDGDNDKIQSDHDEIADEIERCMQLIAQLAAENTGAPLDMSNPEVIESIYDLAEATVMAQRQNAREREETTRSGTHEGEESQVRDQVGAYLNDAGDYDEYDGESGMQEGRYEDEPEKKVGEFEQDQVQRAEQEQHKGTSGSSEEDIEEDEAEQGIDYEGLD